MEYDEVMPDIGFKTIENLLVLKGLDKWLIRDITTIIHEKEKEKVMKPFKKEKYYKLWIKPLIQRIITQYQTPSMIFLEQRLMEIDYKLLNVSYYKGKYSIRVKDILNNNDYETIDVSGKLDIKKSDNIKSLPLNIIYDIIKEAMKNRYVHNFLN